MQRFVLPPLVLALALLTGCAHQSYPELPADVAAQHTDGRVPADPAAQVIDQNATALAANVSSVAEREAQLAPVPQEVVPPPPDPAALPAADARRLEILLGDRRFEYYEDDRLVWSGKISAGAPEHPTPAGEFRVTAKNINKRSGSYTNYFNWPTPMPYAIQFKGPYWVHEGYVPNEHASHGCVRLRHDDARFVYARMQVGDSVKVVR
ncbi:L,D-transpeptidase [Thiohalocapsa sp. ML1]|jgi:lipoprotein-anchoring transpeptidase ErfK/SrfK|uniref:L,D-transpeptidase n=1 Tax=Thiohalocapsa sp. ML1 TaxID=1431688 RepID=UPI000731F783|nr:L,D-transpeptidase [Thiohalocapsa sp. ML1]